MIGPENETPKDAAFVPEKPAPPSRDWIGYVTPMALFMLFTALVEPRFRTQFVPFYALKILLVSGSLLAFRYLWRDIKIEARVLPLALLVGALVFVEWIAVDPHTPHFAIQGTRTAIDPYHEVAGGLSRMVFFGFRFFGLVVTVPIMEELFWRSFLIRYFTDPDRWESLPLGKFLPSAFWFVVFGFALAHQEWLAAIICAIAYGWLLWRTKSLFACIVAHGLTNLLLALYIVYTKQWIYW